ncbi:hypothetical protein JL107_14145 [Nakamurella flavida]|uniref:Uncharacterized protein n=1 Tax=Nakamurella flavida TaxID=363630 RepID=A0A938YMU2_9ACTN|nr:hypothetical protein [Nakamurella flavida]MBM9477588.1 hypothetical protein [Nakamurella flavida]MDP9779136.1 hypothetical protein [Nakamurella flavida]
MIQTQSVLPTPAPRRWSVARTALSTAGLGAVLVALTACGPGGADAGPAVTGTPNVVVTTGAPIGMPTPTPGAPLSADSDFTPSSTTGTVTSDPSGFMDMQFPAGATDQQFVDGNGDHVNVSRNTGGGHSSVSNSSCDASGCETQVIENN